MKPWKFLCLLGIVFGVIFWVWTTFVWPSSLFYPTGVAAEVLNVKHYSGKGCYFREVGEAYFTTCGGSSLTYGKVVTDGDLKKYLEIRVGEHGQLLEYVEITISEKTVQSVNRIVTNRWLKENKVVNEKVREVVSLSLIKRLTGVLGIQIVAYDMDKSSYPLDHPKVLELENLMREGIRSFSVEEGSM